MQVHFVEASNNVAHGKFMLARLEEDELALRSALPGYLEQPLQGIGGRRRLNRDTTLVLDLQTGEGACLYLKDVAAIELREHAIQVCPMFRPFLDWLSRQGLAMGAGDITRLPRFVEIA